MPEWFVPDEMETEPPVPLPTGPRLVHLDRADGWFSTGVHGDDEEFSQCEAAVERLRLAERFRPAFKKIAAVVHKASRYKVYVGRTGGTVNHLLNRFYDHQQNRGARWIFPVVRAPKDKLREEDWEGRAIRWTMARMHEGRLCCNNDVADQRGNWPHTDDCLIYVVACGRPSS